MPKNAKVRILVAIVSLLALNLVLTRAIADKGSGVANGNGQSVPLAQTVPMRTPASTSPTTFAESYLPVILKLETTPTPTSAFITLTPDCGFAPTVQVSVAGYNWPTDETISLFWDGALQSTISAGHPGFFSKRGLFL